MSRSEAAPQSLGRHEVHVWIVVPSKVSSAALEACESLECDDERQRRMRLYAEHDRRDRLVSSALVRRSLSRYASVDPAAWVFERNEHGRPELVAGQCNPRLRFNLSHASGLAACAVTLERDIGVDVENVERRGEVLSIAGRYFSPAEADDVQNTPAQRRRQRFFEYWTLKESYIKARGTGLALALRKFSFRIGDGSIGVCFDPELHDDPADWQFALFRPTDEHVLAIGVRRGPGPDLLVGVRQAELQLFSG